ncbi:unnamed protein product [Victoria cruziana]
MRKTTPPDNAESELTDGTRQIGGTESPGDVWRKNLNDHCHPEVKYRAGLNDHCRSAETHVKFGSDIM